MFAAICAGIGAATSLYGAVTSRNAYNKQADVYEEQARLNREIGSFNAQVAVRTGNEAATNIFKQTQRLVGDQMAAYTKRNVALEGSSLFVIGDTIAMGSDQAQEAYFNAEVSRVNALYGANQAAMNAKAHAESARGLAKSKTLEIFSSLTNAYTGYKSGEDNKSIFDIGQMKV